MNLVAAIICVSPAVDIQYEQCGMLELNHVYTLEGEPSFTQVIAWDWCPHCCDYHVSGWQMVGARGPARNYALDRWEYRPSKDRVIIARCYRRTWTQFDAEMLDRSRVAESDRRLRDFIGGR